VRPEGLFDLIGIQPLGMFWQEPEPSQATGMALARCILGKFLGVVCHCFSLGRIMSKKNSNDTIGNQIIDLLPYSSVPQPTVLPCASPPRCIWLLFQTPADTRVIPYRWKQSCWDLSIFPPSPLIPYDITPHIPTLERCM
jgi:hypothetical protein